MWKDNFKVLALGNVTAWPFMSTYGNQFHIRGVWTGCIYKINSLTLNMQFIHFKGQFTKNKNSVINYLLSCRSKPIRPSFIFRTQMKIFLIKSESFLTLHTQSNYHVQGSALTDTEEKKLLNKVVIFVFFLHKKYSPSFITLRLNHWCHMDYFNNVLTNFLGLESGSCIGSGSGSSWISWKLNLRSEDEQRS